VSDILVPLSFPAATSLSIALRSLLFLLAPWPQEIRFLALENPSTNANTGQLKHSHSKQNSRSLHQTFVTHLCANSSPPSRGLQPPPPQRRIVTRLAIVHYNDHPEAAACASW
jgi:hypothetical protein